MDFRILADNSNDIVVAFNENMECLYANASMEQATGLSARQLIGKKLQEAEIPEDAVNYLEYKIQQTFLTGKGTEYEIQLQLSSKSGYKSWQWQLIPEKGSKGNTLTVFLVGRDITEKKQLIDAHFFARNRFYSLFENIVDIFFETDKKGTITYISPHVEKYGFQAEDIISTNILDIVIPEDREHVTRAYLKLKRYGRIFPVILRIKEKNGKVCWFESRCSRQKDANGTFLGITGILKDITDQKITEERLLKINQCLLAFTTDPLEAIDRLIATSAQLLGADHARYYWIGGHISHSQEKAITVSQKSYNIISKKISIGDEHISTIFLYFPHEYVFLQEDEWVLNTITAAIALEEKRRKSLEALRESENKYKIIFENSPIGIFYMDPSGKILNCNDELVRIIGSSKEFIQGLNILSVLSKNPSIKEGLNNILGGKPFKYRGEYISLFSGKTTPIEASLSTHVAEDGSILGGICTVQDISEHQEKEQVIQILEAVSLAASKFLQMGSSSENFNEVLAQLGKATDVSRLYIFQNEIEEDGTLLMSQKYEWVAHGISPQIDNPLLQRLPYRYAAPRWEKIMKRRYHIAGLIKDFPDEERESLGEQGILSLATVPIYVGKEWWGFIGFDDCKHEREWSMVEMDALWAAADTIGAAIHRQQIEAEVKKSQERQKKILEAVQAGVMLIDAKSHTIVDVNPVAMQFLGRKKEEMVGKVCHEFICPAEKGKCPITDQKQVIDSLERVLLTAKGERLPILKKAAYIELDDRQLIVESFLDLSHIKEAERALMESEEKFKTLFMSANDAIYIYDDMGGKIKEVNDIASDMLGYSRNELLGMSPRDFNAPEYAVMLPDRLKELKNRGHAIYETIYVDSSGKRIPVEVSSRVIEYNGQKAILTVARDITERKMAEEVQKKELLLKEIHHRVKNNLQVISSLLNLQARNFQEKDIKKAFAESQNRIRAMAIAHEKLYKSKDLENIDTVDYVKNLVNYLLQSNSIGTGKVSLELDTDEIYLDIDKIIPIGLIINEVITNSLKYAFNPGEQGIIRVSFKVSDTSLILTISDNGKGIPETIDIFNTDSLGTQLVTTLVEQLGGKLELDRSSGTRFIMTFKNFKSLCHSN